MCNIVYIPIYSSTGGSHGLSWQLDSVSFLATWARFWLNPQLFMVKRSIQSFVHGWITIFRHFFSGTFLLTGVVLADSLLLNWPSGMLQSSNLASENMSRSLGYWQKPWVCGIFDYSIIYIYTYVCIFKHLLKISIEHFEVLLRNRPSFTTEERWCCMALLFCRGKKWATNSRSSSAAETVTPRVWKAIMRSRSPREDAWRAWRWAAIRRWHQWEKEQMNTLTVPTLSIYIYISHYIYI